jgi:hypothetical protein
MSTKIILLAILAACGINSNQATTADVPLGGDPAENAKAAAASREGFERQMQMTRQMQMHAASDRATAPDEPTDKQPPEDPQMDQHFCCQSVDPKTMSGEGCQTMGATQIDLCANVLYCEGNWAKQDGKVTCE